MEYEREYENDITRWAEKLLAGLDAEVEDYYNHCKVTGDDLMDAYEILHRESPQKLTVNWKDVDSMAVKVEGATETRDR